MSRFPPAIPPNRDGFDYPDMDAVEASIREHARSAPKPPPRKDRQSDRYFKNLREAAEAVQAAPSLSETILLSNAVLYEAHQYARGRAREHYTKRRTDRRGYDGDRRLDDERTVRGEFALREWCRRHGRDDTWTGTRFRRREIITIGGLKAFTPRVGNYNLLVYDDESSPDDTPHVLIYADDDPEYEIVGWIYGREGKRPEYWRGPPLVREACFMVPPPALHPMSELPEV